MIAEQQYRRELEARRRRISIMRHPVLTLRYFGVSASRWIGRTTKVVTSHALFAKALVPGLAARLMLELFPGPHMDVLAQVQHVLQFVLWWVGLGILSSVGLGTGVQSGVLFLYPHIMKTCLAAEACNSLNFNAAGNMWFSKAEDLFSCLSAPPLSAIGDRGDEAFWGVGDGGKPSPVTFLKTLLKVYPACVLWGVGTAIGEIPPYVISRAAAKAGKQLLEEDDELNRLERSGLGASGKLDLVARGKVLMMRFLRQHGFWGIFLLSAVPNMAFDLCGICCGHFGMPFWQFFGGTLLGKAGVRVLIQTSFLTMLSNREHLGAFVEIVRRVTPAAWDLGGALHIALVENKPGFHSGAAVEGRSRTRSSPGFAGRLKMGWNVVVVVIMGAFAATVIEQLARTSAAQEDEEKIRDFKLQQQQTFADTTEEKIIHQHLSTGHQVSEEEGCVVDDGLTQSTGGSSGGEGGRIMLDIDSPCQAKKALDGQAAAAVCSSSAVGGESGRRKADC